MPEEQQPVVNETAQAPQATVVSHGPKKRGKLPLLIILLLLAIGAAVYFLVLKKDNKPTQLQQPAVKQIEESPPFVASRQLYFQLGSQVVAYDTQTKVDIVLTDKIPAGGKVLDMYTDGKTWRLYYSHRASQDAKFTLNYLENGQEAQKLAETDGLVFDFYADAKNQLAAYTEFADLTTTTSASKTYVRQDGKTTLVYESDPSSDVDKGVKDSRYFLAGISPDATKLLFQRANCHNCDGGVTATAFELTLADKKTKEVYKATKSQGSIAYFPAGILIEETTMSALGTPNGPFTDTWQTLDAVGSKPKPLFSAVEPTWAQLVHDPLFTYLAVEKRAADYTETGAGTFDALYERTGTTSKALKKLTVDGTLPTTDQTFRQLGPTVGNCFAALLSARGLQTEDGVDTIGVLCKTTAGLNYTKLAEQKYEQQTDFYKQPVATILD